MAGKEKLLGLIGNSLQHSLSPKLFKDIFEKEGRSDFSYHLYPLLSISEFPELIKKESNLIGLNVTIPYKTSVIPYLDELSVEAKEIGAVNTIVISNGKTKGYNTDVTGFKKSISPLLSNEKNKAIILGNGGASKAAAYVFKELGIPYIIVARNPKQNEISFEMLTDDLISGSSIIVNTTPLGMFPDLNSCPSINYENLSSKHLLFDMVYNPEQTVFLQRGKEKGATCMNGFEMLKEQAWAAWEIWKKL